MAGPLPRPLLMARKYKNKAHLIDVLPYYLVQIDDVLVFHLGEDVDLLHQPVNVIKKSRRHVLWAGVKNLSDILPTDI